MISQYRDCTRICVTLLSVIAFICCIECLISIKAERSIQIINEDLLN